jgi:3-methyladenine DNA glycosylase AlkD
MLHPAKAVGRTDPGRIQGPRAAARAAKHALKRMARPASGFDASRYFRGDHDLGFFNVGTTQMRALARSIYAARRAEWGINDAMRFADLMMADRHLEAKSVGIEVVARYRRDFTSRVLPGWRRWLARNQSANWATTDAICGALVGPLLVAHPHLARQMRTWSSDRNLWVRRASAVSLIPSIRQHLALTLAYDIARRLHKDEEDLIQKAVGWMLREAGKVDERRLEHYLRANGSTIPRTTVRYAIERFSPARRAALMTITKAPRPPRELPVRRKEIVRRTGRTGRDVLF